MPNRSSHARAVLLVDNWNPDLTEVERLAAIDLVEGIGDFSEACQIATMPRAGRRTGERADPDRPPMAAEQRRGA